jgi:hypothetical protein
VTDDPRARAIEAMKARDEGEAAEAGMPPALSALYLGFLLDAIPGDVHAHLAVDKCGKCPDCGLAATEIDRLYRLVDPPQKADT